MIRIMIVGETGLLRGAVCALLEKESDMEVAAQVCDRADALKVATLRRPDIVMIDVDLPDTDSLGIAREIHELMPACAVVFLTAHRKPSALRAALDAQVRGFLGKDVTPAELVASVRMVANGERVIDPVAALAALDAVTNPLTRREREILQAAELGLRSKEIAVRLFLASGTVRNHLSAILRKTSSRNQWEAIRRAQDAGWL